MVRFSVLAAGLLLAAAAAAAPGVSLDEPPEGQRSGRYAQVLKGLAARLPNLAGDERIAALYWRAQAQAGLGARLAALDDLRTALGEASASSRETRARLQAAIGEQELRLGADASARGNFEAAASLAPDGAAAAAALAGLAEVERREGQDEAARRLLERSLALAEATRSHATASSSALALGLAARAAQSARAMPDSREKAYHLIAAAQAGRGDEAIAWLDEARAVGARLGDLKAVSYASGEAGLVHERAGRAESALAETRRALFAAQAADAPEALYRWQWQAARLAAAAGREDEALAGYRRAMTTLAPLRQDILADARASRRSYRDAVGPLFLEQADLLLRRARRAGAAQGQRDLLEAREVVESLKAIELEDYFQDECVAAQEARRRDIERVAPRSAVLYPVILPDRVEMLVSTAAGMHQVVLPVAGEELTRTTRALRALLEKRTTHQYLSHARRLYDWLLRPLEPLLAAESVDTLVVVPDAALRLVPIGALHDGERFVVERFALATAPGLRLVEPRALAGQAGRVLLNGLTVSVQQFPPLPHVKEELSAIGALLPATLLTDKEFVLSSFEREVKSVPYSIVHIASHGQFDSDPKKSFLLAYDGRLDMDGLERVIKFSRFRDDPVELLTLSACRTAAGDERAALGLAGVAVKAGARSALATLWYVNDQASSAIVAEFYRRLAGGGTSKARALQEAQLAAMRDARYRHPGYWAPFLLIGNWL